MHRGEPGSCRTCSSAPSYKKSQALNLSQQDFLGEANCVLSEGLLPPLDAPHHVRKHEWAGYREGVTLREKGPNGVGTAVDVGLSKHTSMSPDQKCIVVVGDHQKGLHVDAPTGKITDSVVGHKDFSFASAWHPNGQLFATGNQDKTCCVWDMRNLSKPISMLRGNIGAAWSIRFSGDGQLKVVVEPTDFVHIYNIVNNYKKRQEIDFFGEIAGVSMTL